MEKKSIEVKEINGVWIVPAIDFNVTLFHKFKMGMFDKFYPYTNRFQISEEEFAFWVGLQIGEMIARKEMKIEVSGD